jgi:hypothetical protein
MSSRCRKTRWTSSFIRTVGIARALGMANLVYNFRRLAYLDRIAAA